MERRIWIGRRNSIALVVAALIGSLGATAGAQTPAGPATFCNPIDLPYRFMLKGVPMRMAADPSIVVYKNEYWLFPSKSGGYWHSPDLISWSYVACKTLPVEGVQFHPESILSEHGHALLGNFLKERV